MFDFFQPVIDVFNFIGDLLGTIVNGISGVISIIRSLFNLLLSLTRILPSPLYPCLQVFLGVYITIFTYKIFRKG